MASSSPDQPGVWINSVVWPFKWVVNLLLTLALSWATALALAYAFDMWVWEPGTARDHLQKAFNVILEDALFGGIQVTHSSAASFTLLCANLAYEWVFVSTGLEPLIATMAAGVRPAGVLEKVAFELAVDHQDKVGIFIDTTRLFGAKVGLLVTASPLLFGVYLVGAIDGLAARYIRTQGGGRESSFLYHRSKFATITLMGTVAVALVLLPVPLAPHWVLPLSSILIAMLAYVQWRFYKKYI
jgi:integrating conjugative element membrane protein (TIGR03747 family)